MPAFWQPNFMTCGAGQRLWCRPASDPKEHAVAFWVTDRFTWNLTFVEAAEQIKLGGGSVSPCRPTAPSQRPKLRQQPGAGNADQAAQQHLADAHRAAVQRDQLVMVLQAAGNHDRGGDRRLPPHRGHSHHVRRHQHRQRQRGRQLPLGMAERR